MLLRSLIFETTNLEKNWSCNCDIPRWRARSPAGALISRFKGLPEP